MDTPPANTASGPNLLALTPRQRRLRVLSFLILAVVLTMVVVGVTHPFFRPIGRPEVMTPALEKAIKVKILVIGFYWITVTLLTTSLFALAWLDLREVRRKLLLARRDMWKDILEKHTERRKAKEEAQDSANGE